MGEEKIGRMKARRTTDGIAKRGKDGRPSIYSHGRSPMVSPPPSSRHRASPHAGCRRPTPTARQGVGQAPKPSNERRATCRSIWTITKASNERGGGSSTERVVSAGTRGSLSNPEGATQYRASNERRELTTNPPLSAIVQPLRSVHFGTLLSLLVCLAPIWSSQCFLFPMLISHDVQAIKKYGIDWEEEKYTVQTEDCAASGEEFRNICVIAWGDAHAQA